MNGHFVELLLAISSGSNAVLIVLLHRRADASRRMELVFRTYRRFHIRRIHHSRTAESSLLVDLADAQEKNKKLEQTLKSCQEDRSFFLAQWKIFAPKAEELRVLCEHWESETHYWRKKCWWTSDKKARERDREVVRSALESAAMHGVAAAFSD